MKNNKNEAIFVRVLLFHADPPKCQPRHQPFIFPHFTNCGNVRIFCLRSYVKEDLENLEVPFLPLLALNVSKLVDLETLNSPTLISRKI